MLSTTAPTLSGTVHERARNLLIVAALHSFRVAVVVTCTIASEKCCQQRTLAWRDIYHLPQVTMIY